MSARAYVDQRVDDIVRATAAAESAAQSWGLSAPEVLRCGMNAIFRCDDVVLRVATPTAPASVSIELAEMLAEEGLRVPRPMRTDALVLDGFAVTAWEHVRSVNAAIDWQAVGAMVAQVQQLPIESLPVGLPRPSPTDFPWWDHEALLREVGSLIDSPAVAGIRAAVERHAGWRDFVGSPDLVVCHGDVHPGNVIMDDDGPVLIDWDLLCLAPRGWDHAPLMTWTERWGGAEGVYDAFAHGVGWDGRGDRHAEAFAELRLVAATLMRWKVAAANPDARAEAERRLAYWRGDPDAHQWSAQ